LGANSSFRHLRKPRRAVAALGVLLLTVATASLAGSHAAQAVTAPQALILSDSVTVPGPAPTVGNESLEQYEAEQNGFTVTSVTGTQWDAMTAAQFAAYQVLIIGDAECPTATDFTAAVTNASTWEPVVMKSGGNKVIIGTDPVFHQNDGSGANAWRLIKNGIGYAGQRAGATGAYVDLSCAYNSVAADTAVPLLDGLSSHGPGQFSVVGEASITDACATAVNIVAQTGPTAGLADSDLSNWGCSVHEAFDTFPSDYTPLALAPSSSGFPSTYCADDVTSLPLTLICGAPYILVSGTGVTVTSQLSLAPAKQTLTVGGKAKLTATLIASALGKRPYIPTIASEPIVFNVDSGPNAGVTFTGTIFAGGTATFNYTDTGGVGTDQISATVTTGAVSQKATASVTWAKAKPVLTTALSGGGKSGAKISLPVNTPVSDTSTLTGTGNGPATGMIDFGVYKDAACTKLVAVGGEPLSNGKSVKSPPITLPVGTYYWVSVYGGDINNQAATAKCGSEVLTVLPVSVDTKVNVIGESKATAKVSTTAPGDLIVAYVFGDAGTGAKANEFATVSGGGLTWKLIARSNAERSDAEVWAARATGTLHNATVTITGKFTGFDEGGTIVAYKNAVGVTAVAAHAAKGAPTATVQTTGFDTYVYGVGADWGHLILRTPGPGQVILSQPTDKDADKETFWVQMVSKVIPNPGMPVTLNDTKPTADHYDMVVADVS
jgi:hypothetical protein